MEYGLIGRHLKHSFSKEIHESLESYTYDLVELEENELASFLAKRDFKAVNVTIPYKEKVIPYLDELDEISASIGAVNIIVNNNGRLIGYNSDVYGFIDLVKKSNIEIKDRHVLILGSGGASKAIKYALNILGANKIYIASRNDNKEYLSYTSIYNYQDIEVIINTTPVGMYPNNEESLIDVLKFKNLKGFIDLIYNPIRTKTVIEAELNNIPAFGGLYMLVSQALKSIEIFLNKKIKDEDIELTYQKILRNRQNIVLIGMPTSGKSAIGEVIANYLNIPFIDTDLEIEKDIDMKISELFVLEGELTFRKLESNYIKKIYQTTPKVIATGGGIIKNIENIKYLKQNGKIIFIDCAYELLYPSSSRPLTKNKKDLKKLYETRLPIYRQYADQIISFDARDKEKIAKEILDL